MAVVGAPSPAPSRRSRGPAEDILGRLLALPDAEQPAALERACRDTPEHAEEIRIGFEFLKSAGLIDAAPVNDFPERLGEFRLIEKLGGGGMGVVYLAEQEPLNRTVALKLIRPDQLFFPGARERFRREYEAIAKLQHPGIVPIYTVGEAEGIPYFAMERIEGRTLAEILSDLRGLSPESLEGSDLATAVGAPPESRAFRKSFLDACLRITKQIADALSMLTSAGSFTGT